jgi:hypothetical protein
LDKHTIGLNPDLLEHLHDDTGAGVILNSEKK